MSSTQLPKLSLKISLSKPIYHFSNPKPPQLSLIITSHSNRPFTIFSWHTIFYPKLALAQQGFIITDLTANTEVAQTSIRLQRAAFSRVRGSPDEEYYLTIRPGIVTIVLTPFGRAGDVRPQPKAAVERGWELDEDGNEKKIRRSVHAQGVDGLEAGHKYRLDVRIEGLEHVWWRWGTKEEYLVDRGDEDCMWHSDQWEQGLLDFEPVDGIEFSVED